VRRAPGEDEQKGFIPGMVDVVADIALRVARLGDGVIALPISFLVRIPRIVG
jgi:hypothetical protein